jgi:hypothetical protein
MSNITTSASATITAALSDASYREFLMRFNISFNARLVAGRSRLFTTTADPERLWKAYLSGFADDATRQHHNCTCCRHFIQRFGGLAVLSDDDTKHSSAVWNADEAGEPYGFPFEHMAAIVNQSRINGVFINNKPVGEGRITKTVPYRWGLDETFDVGQDLGTPVVDAYQVPFSFTGNLQKVTVDLET